MNMEMEKVFGGVMEDVIFYVRIIILVFCVFVWVGWLCFECFYELGVEGVGFLLCHKIIFYDWGNLVVLICVFVNLFCICIYFIELLFY